MNTYRIIYEAYDRGPRKRVHNSFEAEDDKTALMIAHPWIGCGCLNEPDDEELEQYSRLTEDDIVSAIDSCNGDGTDYLIYLENETTGEVLYEG